MFKFIKQYKQKKLQQKRLEQLKKNPWKRLDGDNMTEKQKMDQGFNGKTYSINGIDVDF